jgi:hypothetical protein
VGKIELSEIFINAQRDTYLPELLGVVANSLFKLYALPSTGRVYSQCYHLINSLIDKLGNIVKEGYMKQLPPFDKPENEIDAEVNTLLQEMKKDLEWSQKIGDFSNQKQLTYKVASCYQEWMDYCGGPKFMRYIKEEISKTIDTERPVADLIEFIFTTIDKQVQRIIISHDKNS